MPVGCTKMTFQICFVYDQELDYAILREFCEEHGIKYKARPFNSSKYDIDRDNIIRLPAIHIIHNKICLETVYPGIEALNKVENYYTHYARLQRIRYITMNRIGRWLFGRSSLKTDSMISNPRLSTR
jgi:hypothetical protein